MEIVAKIRGKSSCLSVMAELSHCYYNKFWHTFGSIWKTAYKKHDFNRNFDEDNVATLASMNDDSHTKMLSAMPGFE